MGDLDVTVVVLVNLKTCPALGPILATRQPYLGQHCLPPGYGEGLKKRGLNIARLQLSPGWVTATSGFPQCGRNERDAIGRGLKLVNWNVRTLLNSDSRPERQTALVSKANSRL